MTAPGESPKDPSETILEAAADLKEAITDAKAKLLLSLEAAVKVGYRMRWAQKNYYSARARSPWAMAVGTGIQGLLIEAKRLEAEFDHRLAELKIQGAELE